MSAVILSFTSKNCYESDFLGYLENFLSVNKITLSSVITVSSVKKNITIDQIRDLRKQLLTTGSYGKVIVFEFFELATIPAQNAILKLLEDSSSTNHFMLKTLNLNQILPTVSSRCTIKTFRQSKGIINATQKELCINVLDSLKNKDVGFLFGNEYLKSLTNQEATNFFNDLLQVSQGRLRTADYFQVKIVKSILFVLNLLKNYNISPNIAIDLFILKALK